MAQKKKEAEKSGNQESEDFDFGTFRQQVIAGLMRGEGLTGEKGLLKPLIANFVQGAASGWMTVICRKKKQGWPIVAMASNQRTFVPKLERFELSTIVIEQAPLNPLRSRSGNTNLGWVFWFEKRLLSALPRYMQSIAGCDKTRDRYKTLPRLR